MGTRGPSPAAPPGCAGCGLSWRVSGVCLQWNPAVELQAIQRAHRIGQTRAVQAYRFVSEETIEERMLALQEKKRLVFEATISGQVESMVKLTLEDIRFLFKHSS